MGPRTTGTRRRAWPALAISAGLHAVVLVVLVASVRSLPPLPEAPPVQVQLINLPPRSPILRSMPLPDAPPPALRPRPAEAPPIDAPPPPPQLRGAAERGPAPQAAQAPDNGPRMNFYQDNLKGCEKEALILMSPTEAERCRARIAAAALAAPRGFRRDAPPIEALSGLAAARRAALDEEVERRARAGRPMGNPVVACEGPGANLGLGCLAEKDER